MSENSSKGSVSCCRFLKLGTGVTAVGIMTKGVIDQHGADSVSFYGLGQPLLEESYPSNQLFKAGFGINNVDIESGEAGSGRVYLDDNVHFCSTI